MCGNDSTHVFLFISPEQVFVGYLLWPEYPKNSAKIFSVKRGELGGIGPRRSPAFGPIEQCRYH